MAAGLGFKTFTTGEVLTAADTNGYLMQGINVFASTAARDAAITSPQEGQFAFTKDTNGLWYYDGAAWVASGATGDIEGVTAGIGISGGGTSGTVTVTNSMATAIDAKADLVVGTGADTFSRLAVGANNTVLTADSTVSPTGLKWAAPSAGAFTFISKTTITAQSSQAFDSVFSNTYTNYKVFVKLYASVGSNVLKMNLRKGGVTQATAGYYGAQANITFGGTAGTYLTNALTYANIGEVDADVQNSGCYDMDFYGVATTANDGFTNVSYTGFNAHYKKAYYGGFMYGVNDAYDGFIITPTSGTITGQVFIYGQADS
jgi:hypothetical protein